ncbi:hypothetical protein [Actinomyces howellii]|uniref:Rho termination factor, N-terminal domain n=1 Tax=Actinomyces howellii TaxID=52771 RepID=A0A448HGN7_9ACTO|nr:hypothetical protein [Actinomyces howellii]VEG28041.1 Uncharacterised protein [Actinomyces howellii]
MRRLVTHVVVHRPAGSVMLPAGAVLGDEDAALVTNPSAWVDDGAADDDGGAEDEDEGAGASGEVPSEAWTVAQIREWAEAHGVDLGRATTKADLLLIIGDELAAEGDAGRGAHVA